MTAGSFAHFGKIAAVVATSSLALVAMGRARATQLYQTSDACIACHNNLATPSGEDVSIGSAWRATMMANSSRDPYWQAAVRREILDHPGAAAAIENECSTCHMPMMQSEAKSAGGTGAVFAHLPVGVAGAGGASPVAARQALLAADGVSCTVCHQMTDENFGAPESFNGHFTIDTTQPWGARPVYGRHAVDSGRVRIMHSSSEFVPTQGEHVQRSELCASCHTLFTDALGPGGTRTGRLPEQVPYLEWRHSSFAATTSCQQCHMPVVTDSMPISGVWGLKRAGLARHEFLGGNFLVLEMLKRYRAELGVTATVAELDRGIRRTIEHLGADAGRVSVGDVTVTNGRLRADVSVRNLTGHKLPTAYPSRRVWLHVAVRDADGRVVFESGAVRPDGAIVGNDNDANPTLFEPHYTEVRSRDQVQIYESILADPAGRVTTGLITAVRYLKDNRLLPNGFDKRTASSDIAVHGEAMTDADFTAGTDLVRYVADVSSATGPFSVTATLRYQPIAFRWAENLGTRHAPEITRFRAYYTELAPMSSAVIASDSVRTR